MCSGSTHAGQGSGRQLSLGQQCVNARKESKQIMADKSLGKRL